MIVPMIIAQIQSDIETALRRRHSEIVAGLLLRIEIKYRVCSYARNLHEYVRLKRTRIISGAYSHIASARAALYAAPCGTCLICLARRKPWPRPNISKPKEYAPTAES